MAKQAPRVLVLDDSIDARESIKLLLELNGFAVETARNGEEGLRLQRARPADVVVTDVFMPEKDGVETLAALRKEFPRVKVVVISGSAGPMLDNILVAARELGAHTVLHKPFDPRELVAIVRNLTA